MLACNCLNVIIDSEINDFQKVTLNSLKLTEDEGKDYFFKQDIQKVGKLNKITKTHPDLVCIRNVGSWLIHNCLNCDIHTHAIHKEKGATLVLVACRLLNTGSITALRNSDQYSPTFNIIVNYNPLEDEKDYDYLPADIERTVANLKQRANEVIKKEAAAIEERIRLFTEQQYAALDELRDKVQKEHKALVRIILKKKLKSVKNVDSRTTKNLADYSSKQKVFYESLSDTQTSTKSKNILDHSLSNSPKLLDTKHKGTRSTSSFDAEGLFPLEDMEDSQYSCSETEESDNEEPMKEERGVPINSKCKDLAGNLAKSLPMNIPTFMSSLHNHLDDDVDDLLLQPADTMDIAASIKALARSVHGDTVFGDLPRPRFSTHI